MKWYFALSEASLERHDHDWSNTAINAVRSAKRNTSLRPHLLFDGAPCALTRKLADMGVTVIRHRVSFFETLERRGAEITSEGGDGAGYVSVASACFLRIDIPEIEQEDDFVLYTDCDVMFLADPALEALRPAIFAAAPQTDPSNWDDLNSGVMLINVRSMKADLPVFHRFIDENIHLGLDQEILYAFYKGRYDKLDLELNWKPYWGVNSAARILHWHGPKPIAAQMMIDDPDYDTAPIWRSLCLPHVVSYQNYLRHWNEFSAMADLDQ